MANGIKEMVNRAQVHAPDVEDAVYIPASLWGSADDIEIQSRVLTEGAPRELCVNFTAEGGYAGGRLRVSDIIEVIAKHHPEVLQQALARASANQADNC